MNLILSIVVITSRSILLSVGADGGNLSCHGYILNGNTYVKNGRPKPRTCEVPSTANYYSQSLYPATYRDSSCCSSDGAYSVVNGPNHVFYAPWEHLLPSGICAAHAEMMSLIICDPNQAKYIEHETSTLRVCKNSCEKLFDACGLPGVNYNSLMEYQDPVSMCQELWHGRASDGIQDCKGQINYLCATGLWINIVETDCLSMMDPSESLIRYHEQVALSIDHDQKSSRNADFKYPNGCVTSGARQADGPMNSSSRALLTTVAFSIIFVMLLLCLVYGLFVAYYFWPEEEERSKAIVSYAYDKETQNDYQFLMKSATFCQEALDPILEEVRSGGRDSVRFEGVCSERNSSGGKHSNATKNPNDCESVDKQRFTFLQDFDLRELKDQKDCGYIDDDDYESRRNSILNSRYV
jgi:hypothetical protein